MRLRGKMTRQGLRIKRFPSTAGHGRRRPVLVDRLWPRGLPRERADLAVAEGNRAQRHSASPLSRRSGRLGRLQDSLLRRTRTTGSATGSPRPAPPAEARARHSALRRSRRDPQQRRCPKEMARRAVRVSSSQSSGGEPHCKILRTSPCEACANRSSFVHRASQRWCCAQARCSASGVLRPKWPRSWAACR